MAFRAAIALNDESTGQPSSISGTIPGAVGDIVLVSAMQSTGVNTMTIAGGGSGGWTLLRGPTVVNSNITGYLWGKKLSASDVGATVTITSTGAARFLGVAIAMSGDDVLGTAIHNFAPSTAGGTSISSPAVTTTVDGCDIVCFWAVRSATDTAPQVTVPGTHTKAAEANTNVLSPNFDICASYRTTTGAHGVYGGNAATISQTATGAVSYTVALAPAAGGGSTGLQAYAVDASGNLVAYSAFYVDASGALVAIG